MSPGRFGVPGRVGCLVALSLLLAACAGVPTSGPIQQGPVVAAAGGDQFIRVIARAPSAGMTREEVVRGFQEATASADAGYSIARQYLTPLASSTWRPYAGIQVYDDAGLTSTLKGDVVSQEGVLTATIDGSGQYSVVAPTQRTRWDYDLAQVDGQWRISALPPGLVLGPGDISRSYRNFDLYYFTRDFATLVPAPVTLPVSSTGLATTLVRGLLGGPTPWIAPAVRSAFPENTRLALDSVPVVDGVADVALTREVLNADDTTRQKLSAQLVWTLRQLPDVTGVRMTVNGQALTVPGVATVQPIDSWSIVSPDALPATARAFAVGPKGLVQLGDGDTTTPFSVRPALVSPGVSLDSASVAGLGEDGRTLYVGKLADGSTAARRYAGTDLSRPTWDSAGAVWFVDRGRGLLMLRGAEVLPMRVADAPPEFADRNIVAASMARDGTRLALLVKRGALVEPWLARVERNGKDVRVAAPIRVDSEMTGALDLAWADADTLAVLGSAGAASLEIADIAVGSSRVRHSAAPDASVTTLAGAPGRTELVGNATGLWRATVPTWTREDGFTDPVYPG